ncbi:MAG: 2-oxo acid dehydrogenase subunit E2 [Candidatus Odinarchaeota archaeon]
MKTDNDGNYSIKPFSINRQVLSDFYDEQFNKHNMIGLLEVDITGGKELIKRHFEKTGEKISFVAWISKYVSQALSEQPEIHSMRQGRKKLVTFEDIDITVLVERQVDDKRIPVPKILRKTNEKTVKELSREVRQAQEQKVEESDQLLGNKKNPLLLSLFLRFPKFIRRHVYRRTLKNPFKVKRDSGTVIITSVGMFAKDNAAFVISFGFLPVSIALGGITRKPGVVANEIRIREYLYMTIMIDHDVVDGAPAARFVARAVELMEKAFGLEFIS